MAALLGCTTRSNSSSFIRTIPLVGELHPIGRGNLGSRTIPPVKNCSPKAAHFALKNWENGWFFSILDLVVAIVYAKKNNLSRGNKKRASPSGKGTQTAWILFLPHNAVKTEWPGCPLPSAEPRRQEGSWRGNGVPGSGCRECRAAPKRSSGSSSSSAP